LESRKPDRMNNTEAKTHDDSNDAEAQLDQYLKAMSLYDSEMDRSWTRLNIFIGLQVGFFVLIMTLGRGAEFDPMLCRIAMAVLLSVSVSTAVVTTRGLMTQRSMIKGLWKLEIESGKRFYLLHKFRSVTRAPLIINNAAALVLSYTLFILWVVLLIYFEAINYRAVSGGYS